MSDGTYTTLTSACPSCGEFLERPVYDVGSGPEVACGVCEWCWGAEGQDLRPITPESSHLRGLVARIHLS